MGVRTARSHNSNYNFSDDKYRQQKYKLNLDDILKEIIEIFMKENLNTRISYLTILTMRLFSII